MKKVFTFLLSVMLVFCMISCSSDPQPKTDSTSTVLSRTQIMASVHVDNIIGIAQDFGPGNYADKYYDGFYYTGNISVSTTTANILGKTIQAAVSVSELPGQGGDTIRTTVEITRSGNKNIQEIEYNGNKVSVDSIYKAEQAFEKLEDLFDFLAELTEDTINLEDEPVKLEASGSVAVTDTIVLQSSAKKNVFTLAKGSSIEVDCKSIDKINLSASVSGAIGLLDYQASLALSVDEGSDSFSFSANIGNKSYRGISDLEDFLIDFEDALDENIVDDIEFASGGLSINGLSLDFISADHFAIKCNGDLKLSVIASGLSGYSDESLTYHVQSNGLDVKLTNTSSDEFSCTVGAVYASKTLDENSFDNQPQTIEELYDFAGIKNFDYRISYKEGKNQIVLSKDIIDTAVFYALTVLGYLE